jgi:membrane protease YdiL (CAAX protease family)
MFCPSCKDEFREGFSWCPDCDVALVETLPDEPVEEEEEGWNEEEVFDFDWGGEDDDEEEQEQQEDSSLIAVSPSEARLRSRELLLVLFVSFGGSIVHSIYARLNGLRYSYDPTTLDTLLAIVKGSACLALLAYVLGRRGRALQSLGLTAKRADILPTILLVAAAFLPTCLSVAIRRGPDHVLDLFKHHNFLSSGPLQWIGFLFNASQEELIVRAYMITEVIELTGQVALAVLASACLQALYHLYQGSYAAMLHSLTFMISSVYYVKYRRATPLVLGHFLYDMLI